MSGTRRKEEDIVSGSSLEGGYAGEKLDIKYQKGACGKRR